MIRQEGFQHETEMRNSLPYSRSISHVFYRVLILLFITFASVNICLARGSEIRISADPALPVKNLIINGSFEECEEDYEGFHNTDPTGFAFSISSNACTGKKALNAEKYVKNAALLPVFRLCFWTGPGTYIASIMGKPRKGTKYLGMKWKAAYYKGGKETVNEEKVNISYKPVLKGQWQKAVSKPFTIPENAEAYKSKWNSGKSKGFHQFRIGLFADNAGGLLDDACISTAYTNLTVEVKNAKGIKRVMVTDDTGKRVIDSGKLKALPKTWKKTRKVLTPYRYTVRVAASDGSITKKTYPTDDNEM